MSDHNLYSVKLDSKQGLIAIASAELTKGPNAVKRPEGSEESQYAIHSNMTGFRSGKEKRSDCPICSGRYRPILDSGR